jgi:hypothetical protein
MQGERTFEFDGVEYLCRFYNGYSYNWYCTVYKGEERIYLGEISDITIVDDNVEQRIKQFINENA